MRSLAFSFYIDIPVKPRDIFGLFRAFLLLHRMDLYGSASRPHTPLVNRIVP